MPQLLDEAHALRARYDEEPSHSDHVALLALQAYDSLTSWHGFAPRHRELLHAAALLHDIGWSQTPDGKGHHKWSARLIQDADWTTLNKGELPVIALVARYHRKAIPEPDHDGFQALSNPDKSLVMVLGGILRIADALDRTHTGRIESLQAGLTRNSLLVQVKPTGPWEAEEAMFKNKRDMLQCAAKRPVLCEEL